jgi:WD40 repeat protein
VFSAFSHIFGLKGDVKSCIHYIDEHVLVYPAGHNTIIYNTEDRKQKFIHGTEGTEGISAMAVCPSKRFVAVAEKAERGLVNMYDLKTLKKRKVLSTTEITSKQYVSVAFSQDNQLLLTMGGAPDWTLICWNWAKAKPVAITKIANGVNGINQCSFSLVDPTYCCISGNGCIKFFRIVDNQFRAMTAPRIEPQNFTSHSWLKQKEDSVVVGTAEGDLYLFVAGEYETRLTCSPGDHLSIDSIISYSKGFICGGDDGCIWIFDAVDDPPDSAGSYTCVKSLKVEGSSAKTLNLAVSQAEESLAFTLSNNQMYGLALNSVDSLKPEDMDFISTSFHGPGISGSSHITGLDTCVRKPMAITCGMDKSVRVWNYLDKTRELCKTFPEEAHSTAFHPSGLYILVGFGDKLRLMNLLMDDIRPFKEFPIKACRECRFSNGGQMFAAVNGNTIQIFSTYTCEIMATLRGHNGKVRSLYWMHDDSGLVSAGMDGAVYQWDLDDYKREGEFVQKGCNYSSALCNQDGNAVFAVGSDHMLKEIEFPVSQVSKELDCGVILGQIVLSHSQRMLFAGTADPEKPGCVRSYKFPLTGDFTEYQCLSSPITRMRISYDDQYLFVTGEDGSLCIMEVREKDSRGGGRREGRDGVSYAEEILVTKSDLEEKNSLMQELKNKVDELTLHNEYQLRLRDMNYNEKIKEVTEKFTQELEQDKNKFELLREEKNDMEMEYEERIKQMEEKHQHELQEIEATFQQKIMAEVEKYQQLVHERDLQQQQWEQQQKQLVDTHDAYVSEVKDEFEERLEQDRDRRLQMEEEKAELVREFEETKYQLEQDIDQEIEDLKARYDNKLNAEREATLRYKGENGIMKKKFSALQKDIEDQREEIKALLEKEKELYEQIKSLEKEIQAHKREIRGRDETIGEKEKRIYDLKKKNQELEKFKFVLDYKIKELKRQIEPRENEITDMKEQIKEMDHELEQFHKSNAQLDLMIGELRKRLDSMQMEIMRQRASLGDQESLVRRFRSELHESVQYIQDPKMLRDSIAKLYKKQAKEQVHTGELDVNIQSEYHRQREFLERSVDSLKLKFARDVQLHKQDNMRIMQDNMNLIKEINELRQQQQAFRLQQQEASVLGSAGASSKPAAARQPAIADASSRVHANPNEIVQTQREQIGELRVQIAALQAHLENAQPKLPPMDGFDG